MQSQTNHGEDLPGSGAAAFDGTHRIECILGLGFEYFEGEDSNPLGTQGGPLPIASAIDSLLRACEALAEAQVSGSVNRDLKPSRLGLLAQYMSPEQVQAGAGVDERSDIWTLGAIAYELLAGGPPFQAGTVAELSARIVLDPAPRLTQARADVPRALEAVVLRCLEKNPSRRFANLAELSRALVGFGTERAHESAVWISRVVEGGIEGSESFPPLRPSPAPRLPGRAVGRSTPEELPISARWRRVSLLLATVALLAAGGGIGRKVYEQSQDVRAAAARVEPAGRMASPAAESTNSAATATPVSVRTSITSTTGATLVMETVSTSKPTPVPPPSPAQIAPQKGHHAHRAIRHPAADPMPSPRASAEDNPFAAASAGAGHRKPAP